MEHYILVKWNPDTGNREELAQQAERLFQDACRMPGIFRTELFRNCVERENRYDLMIRMELEPDALERFDRSEIHSEWKRRFGEKIEKKAIFDCFGRERK